MTRPLRFDPPGVPLHARVRGNQRQDVFADDSDRRRYLHLSVRHCGEHGVHILGCCQMTNHIHLIFEPASDAGLTIAMMRIQSEYAQKCQFRLGRTGHLRQGRYRPSPMDDRYLRTALRYVERNPVRAAMVNQPEEWMWSSAGADLGLSPWPDWLDRRRNLISNAGGR